MGTTGENAMEEPESVSVFVWRVVLSMLDAPSADEYMEEMLCLSVDIKGAVDIALSQYDKMFVDKTNKWGRRPPFVVKAEKVDYVYFDSSFYMRKLDLDKIRRD